MLNIYQFVNRKIKYKGITIELLAKSKDGFCFVQDEMGNHRVLPEEEILSNFEFDPQLISYEKTKLLEWNFQIDYDYLSIYLFKNNRQPWSEEDYEMMNKILDYPYIGYELDEYTYQIYKDGIILVRDFLIKLGLKEAN